MSTAPVTMEWVVGLLRQQARLGMFDGTEFTTWLIPLCTYDHQETGTRVMFTRDTGHHTSGWFKNPDYERCYHLSLSFRDRITGETVDFDEQLARRWVQAFYGESGRMAWIEGPHTPEGRQRGVRHYRLFADARWHPIKPRGEVYSTEFTEKGWKSASELYETAGQEIVSPLYPG